MELLGVSSSPSLRCRMRGWITFWMCFEVGKTLNLIRHPDYSPIPVAFLVFTHTNELHRAGSGTQLSKVFQFLAQFWLQSVNIDPTWGFSSRSGDNFGCGHPFVEAQGHCHREKEPLPQWFFKFIMDKVTTNLISFWFNVMTSNSAKVKRRWYQTEPENKFLLNESQGLGKRSYLLQEIYILLLKYLPLQTMPLVSPQTMPDPKTRLESAQKCLKMDFIPVLSFYC